MAETGLFEAMYTMRAIRRFKPDAVPPEMIQKVIEAATQAPSGTNRQPWGFVVVRDPDTKGAIGALYKQAWDAVFGSTYRGRPVDNRVLASAQYLAEHMGEAPVLLFVCVDHERAGGAPVFGRPVPWTRGASIYPAVQNLLLAARGLGLGAVLTTLHKNYEDEVRAILGLPAHVETAALIPMGFPAERFGPTRRRPASEVTYYERWGNVRAEG